RADVSHQPHTPERLGPPLRTRERRGLRRGHLPTPPDRPPDGRWIRRAAHHGREPRCDRQRPGIGGPLHLRGLAMPERGRAVAGFLGWYVILAGLQLMGPVARFRPRPRVPTAPPPTTFATPVPPPFAVSPTLSPTPPAGSWSPGLPVASPGAAFRDPGRIPREYTPSFTPPPYGYPPVRFQCPFCGWVEARYDSGRFTCTRCGRSA